MICRNCGCEFLGDVCTNCGAAYATNSVPPESQQQPVKPLEPNIIYPNPQ